MMEFHGNLRIFRNDSLECSLVFITSLLLVFNCSSCKSNCVMRYNYAIKVTQENTFKMDKDPFKNFVK